MARFLINAMPVATKHYRTIIKLGDHSDCLANLEVPSFLEDIVPLARFWPIHSVRQKTARLRIFRGPSASLKCNPGPPPERGRSPGGPGLKDFPARGPDSAWNAAAVPSDPGVSGPSAGRKAPRRDRPGKGGRSPTETRTVPPVWSFPPASRQVQAPQGGCARPIASAGVRWPGALRGRAFRMSWTSLTRASVT